MIEQAVAAIPGARFHRYDGRRLPFAAGSFDVAFCVCVLHHVAHAERPDFVRELGRVVRPGGLAAVFEHNPLNPLTRLAVDRCEFDDGVRLVGRRATARLMSDAGLRPVECRYIVLAPFGGRGTERLERALAPVPLGAQYYVAAERR